LNKATSLNQILETLSEVLGELPEVTYQPARSGDIRHSRANNKRLLDSFKMSEPTPLDVGLARLLGR
jgi:UDP-glucose 4-epimerase